jgi:ubiquinol-cytochrome c reductase cytochrome b subunit
MSIDLNKQYINYFFLIISLIMRIFKSHPLLKLINSYLIDSSQPSNISYA